MLRGVPSPACSPSSAFLRLTTSLLPVPGELLPVPGSQLGRRRFTPRERPGDTSGFDWFSWNLWMWLEVGGGVYTWISDREKYWSPNRKKKWKIKGAIQSAVFSNGSVFIFSSTFPFSSSLLSFLLTLPSWPTIQCFEKEPDVTDLCE